MSYIKTTWVDGETVINAEKLNKIEDALSSFDEDITSLTSGYFPSSITIGSTVFTELQLQELLAIIDATGVEF